MAIGTAAAILGSAAIGAAASGIASSKAAKAQTRAAGDANARLDRQFEITRADQMPWMDAGKGALAQLVAGTGPNGQFMRTFGAEDFQADPGYQFRLDEGNRGIEASAAARGGLLSGAAAKALTRYNSGQASQEYGAAYNRFNNDRDSGFNRLASLAGVGQAATNQVGAAGQNTAQAVSQNITGAGNARASGYVGAANAISNGIGQAYNGYQQNQLLSMLNNRQSGPGMGWGDIQSGWNSGTGY